MKKTPVLLSSQRRALSTQERYGPTPPRPISPSPNVNVKRHTPAGRRSSSSILQRVSSVRRSKSPIRKKAKVNVIAETPAATGTQYIQRLPTPSRSKANSSQANNSSSYYSLKDVTSPGFSMGETNQTDLFDDSYSKSWNPSMTIISPDGSKITVSALDKVAFTEPRKKNNKLEIPDMRRKSLPVHRTPPSSLRHKSASPISRRVSQSPAKPNRMFQDSAQKRLSNAQAVASTPVSRLSPRKSTVRSSLVTRSPKSSQPSKSPRGMLTGRASIRSALKPSTVKKPMTDKKGVKFGPKLSPEQFDYRLPPSTPLKRGALPPPSSAVRARTPIVSRPRPSSVPRVSASPKAQRQSTATPQKTASRSPKSVTQSSRKPASNRASSEPRSPRYSGVEDLFATPSPKQLSAKPSPRATQSPVRKSAALKRKLSRTPRSADDSESEDLLFASTTATIGSSFHSPTPKRARVSGAGRESVMTPRRPGGTSKSPKSPRLSGISTLMKTPSPNRRSPSRSRKSVVVNLTPRPRHSVELTQKTSTLAGRKHQSLAPPKRVTDIATKKSRKSVSRISITAKPRKMPEQVQRQHPKVKSPLQGHRRVKSLGPQELSGIQKSARRSLSATVLSIPPPSRRESLLKKITTTPVRPSTVKTPRISAGRVTVVATPKVSKTSRLSGVRQLVKTPKSQKSPRLSGVSDMLKTPVQAVTKRKSQSSPKLAGIRQLVKTPKKQPSPRLAGVRDMLKTPKGRPSARLSGVLALMKTPTEQRSPRLSGVRKLMKTPKEIASPKLAGVRKLLKTPKTERSPKLSGVRNLLKTPKTMRSPKLSGVRDMLKTPKEQRSPRVSGVRMLVRTPKRVASPRLSGIHALLASPEPKSPLKTPVKTPAKSPSKTPIPARGRRGKVLATKSPLQKATRGKAIKTPVRRGRRAATAKPVSPAGDVASPEPKSTPQAPTPARRTRRVATKPVAAKRRGRKSTSNPDKAVQTPATGVRGRKPKKTENSEDEVVIVKVTTPVKRGTRGTRAKSAKPSPKTKSSASVKTPVKRSRRKAEVSTPETGGKRARAASPMAAATPSKRSKTVEDEPVVAKAKTPVKRGTRGARTTAAKPTPKAKAATIKKTPVKRSRRKADVPTPETEDVVIVKVTTPVKKTTRGRRAAASPTAVATPAKRTRRVAPAKVTEVISVEDDAPVPKKAVRATRGKAAATKASPRKAVTPKKKAATPKKQKATPRKARQQKKTDVVTEKPAAVTTRRTRAARK